MCVWKVPGKCLDWRCCENLGSFNNQHKFGSAVDVLPHTKEEVRRSGHKHSAVWVPVRFPSFTSEAAECKSDLRGSYSICDPEDDLSVCV